MKCTAKYGHRPGSKAAQECSVCGRAPAAPLAATPPVPELGEDARLRAYAGTGALLQAEDESTSGRMLSALAGHHDSQVRLAVARNPSTPGPALVLLVDDRDQDVSRAAMSAAALPPEVLVRMGGSGHGSAAWFAAGHPSTPTAVLEALSTHSGSHVRMRVAGNPSAPQATLLALAADEEPPVRRRAARNPSLPSETLGILSRDTDDEVAQVARGMFADHISRRFNISTSSTGAIEVLSDMPWWELTREDPQVQLVFALHPAEGAP